MVALQNLITIQCLCLKSMSQSFAMSYLFDINVTESQLQQIVQVHLINIFGYLSDCNNIIKTQTYISRAMLILHEEH